MAATWTAEADFAMGIHGLSILQYILSAELNFASALENSLSGCKLCIYHNASNNRHQNTNSAKPH